MQNTASCSMARLEMLVLDEADRLLDMGLGPTIEEILGLIQEQSGDVGATGRTGPRQNILVSATLRADVQNLARISLTNARTAGFAERRIPVKRAVQKKAAAQDMSRFDSDDEGAVDRSEVNAGHEETEEGDDGDGRGKKKVPHEEDGVVDFGEEQDSSGIEIPVGLRQHALVVRAKRKLVALVAFLKEYACSG